MKKQIYLFIIKGIIDDRLQLKIDTKLKDNLTNEDLDNVSCSEYDNINIILCYLNPLKIIEIKESFSTNNMLIESYDVTNQIINQTKDKWLKIVSKKSNSKKIIDKFISDNLSIDIILDKINSNGIKSLLESELLFLENLNRNV